MNYQTINRASAAAVGLLIVSVLFAAAAVKLKLTQALPAIDEDRAMERTKALSEIRAIEEKSLETPGWIDQSHGVVRLPLETALSLAARQWQNPAAARAELIARQEKASAELPKAPEKPSAFE
ncbi:MAG: hypothetical protein WCS94_00615 [Verrucomicrobiota bacterium]